MTHKQENELLQNDIFHRLNKKQKQKQKVAEAITSVMKRLDGFYYEEIEAVIETIQYVMKQSCQFQAIHAPNRDRD